MVTLLPDIFRCIIDELHDDKSALTLCSQVCREWLSPSRFHLFSVVRVYAYDPESGTSDIASFNHFLSRTPYICYYVKQLEVFARKRPKVDRQHGDSEPNLPWPTPPLPFSICCDVISKLPKSSKLLLRGVAVQIDTAMGLLPSILDLDLLSVTLVGPKSNPTDSSTYWDIIRPFQNLRGLTVIRCLNSRKIWAKAVAASFPKPPLRHLYLRDGEGGYILRRLLQAKYLQSITSLNVECGSSNATSTLNRVIEQCGRQLELIVIIVNTHLDDDFPRLGLCTRLRSITFDVICPRVVLPEQWDLVTHTIRSIPPSFPQFERTVIRVKIVGEFAVLFEDLKAIVKWWQLQAALEAHNTLKEIRIIFYHLSVPRTEPMEGNTGMFAEFLQTSLPHSYSKGIVRASFLLR